MPPRLPGPVAVPPYTPQVDSPGRDPLLGRVVGRRYRVLARIARGGMATVYRAEDTRLGREVALKVMHPHLAESADFVDRFHDEARAAASLQHRHVVAVHDAGEDDDVVWLAMELLPGRTLRDSLRERGAFTPAETFDVMQALLLALADAHAEGLVHRDVKPENVLLARDGTWKVNDFGLARAAASSRTATGSLLGTPEYIAPETAQTGQVDPRVDLYSAGIVLFELLTGRQPHTGAVPFQVVWAHVTTDVPPPSLRAPHLPPAVDELVADACARDPEARVVSAEVMLADLRRVWSGLDPAVLDTRAGTAAPAPGEPPDGRTRVLERHDTGAGGGRPGTAASRRPGSRATGYGGAGSAAAGYAGSTTTILDRHEHGDGDDHRDDPFPRGSSGAGDPAGATTMVRGPRRRRPNLSGVLLGLLLLTLAGGAALFWFEIGPGALRDVPDLRGRTVLEAEQQLQGAGLASATATTTDETAPEGTVVGTRPGPGDQVNKNGTVTLVVSVGPELFDVPDARGLQPEQAQELLTGAGLAVGEPQEAYDSDVEEGMVASQAPAPGESVRSGTEVVLVLSLGPEPVTVPDVTGGSVSDARSALEAAGLELGVTQEQFGDAPVGEVVDQDPEEGRVLPGTDVDVTVSQGPEPVVVPDVSDSRFSDAVVELEGLDLVVQRRGPGIFDRVVGQDPTAGTELAPGSTVVLRTF